MNKRRLILMTVLIGVVVLFSATVSYSAFAIKLKNGRNIYAESYWIEGDYVHLQFKSGVMKIRRMRFSPFRRQKEGSPTRRNRPDHRSKNPEKSPVKNPLSPQKRKSPLLR